MGTFPHCKHGRYPLLKSQRFLAGLLQWWGCLMLHCWRCPPRAGEQLQRSLVKESLKTHAGEPVSHESFEISIAICTESFLFVLRCGRPLLGSLTVPFTMQGVETLLTQTRQLLNIDDSVHQVLSHNAHNTGPWPHLRRCVPVREALLRIEARPHTASMHISSVWLPLHP